MWTVLEGDYSHGIPEAQVPKTTGSSSGPANPRNVGRRKREEESYTKKRVSKKGNRTKKRIQKDTKRGKRETGRTETLGQEEKNNETRNLGDNKRNEREMGNKKLRRGKTRTRKRRKQEEDFLMWK